MSPSTTTPLSPASSGSDLVDATAGVASDCTPGASARADALPLHSDWPILVVQHSPDVEPGFFGEYLTEHGIGWQLLRIDQGESPPPDMSRYRGLGLMGGEMSVNDDLPWIPQICHLIRDADRRGLPVIGHCLGGQLMAKALGAHVKRHVRQELGWGQLTIADPQLGQEWLGLSGGQIPTFQWHGDTFDWPVGAKPLLTGAFCEHQAYVLPRPEGVAHLGMQCHMEMTQDLVRRWVAKGGQDIDEALAVDASAVQTAQEILKDLDMRCEVLRTLTRRLYDRWVNGLPTTLRYNRPAQPNHHGALDGG